MFTQKISMDCTKEQYEKYLKDELLKMGYKEYSINCWEYTSLHYVCNSFEGNLGNLGTIGKNGIENYNRHYLGSFNAPLFLALAAMTDKAEGNYGEYVISPNAGVFCRMNKDDRILSVFKFIRKATKEEIMAKFGENKTHLIGYRENLIKEIGIEEVEALDRLKREVVNSYISQTINQTKELEAISHLKSKGYKILKPKTWEEI